MHVPARLCQACAALALRPRPGASLCSGVHAVCSKRGRSRLCLALRPTVCLKYPSVKLEPVGAFWGLGHSFRAGARGLSRFTGARPREIFRMHDLFHMRCIVRYGLEQPKLCVRAGLARAATARPQPRFRPFSAAFPFSPPFRLFNYFDTALQLVSRTRHHSKISSVRHSTL